MSSPFLLRTLGRHSPLQCLCRSDQARNRLRRNWRPRLSSSTFQIRRSYIHSLRSPLSLSSPSLLRTLDMYRKWWRTGWSCSDPRRNSCMKSSPQWSSMILARSSYTCSILRSNLPFLLHTLGKCLRRWPTVWSCSDPCRNSCMKVMPRSSTFRTRSSYTYSRWSPLTPSSPFLLRTLDKCLRRWRTGWNCVYFFGVLESSILCSQYPAHQRFSPVRSCLASRTKSKAVDIAVLPFWASFAFRLRDWSASQST